MSDPVPGTDKYLRIEVKNRAGKTKRIFVPGPDPVIGTFFFVLDVTAATHDLYLPLSIASGKKPTGFVYQIEGDAPGSIGTTSISCEGEGVTQITLGTLVYSKIPKGMTASFRIEIEMRGKVKESHWVVIRQVNYKFDPSDARYQKSPQAIASKTLKFS